MTELRIPFDQLRQFAQECLVAAGAPAEVAAVTARFLTRTDAFGIHSHGLKNLAGYLDKARRGGIDLTAAPTVVAESESYTLLDAHAGLGMVSGVAAIETAIGKARDSGIALSVVRGATHFGAAGGYARLAAEAGMIGIAVSNVDPNMTVPGARGKVVGNNPLAYAFPADDHRPVVFDIALSAVASLKVVEAKRRGEPVPPGWIIDGSGHPTTDPSRYPDEGAMLPMAGHKGYGLAVLVDALTGLLADAPTSDQVPSWLFAPDEPNDVTFTFIVISPDRVGGPGYAARAAAYLDRLHASPLAEGATEILHPGQLEWRSWDRAMADGVPLPEGVRLALETAGRDTGVTAPW